MTADTASVLVASAIIAADLAAIGFLRAWSRRRRPARPSAPPLPVGRWTAVGDCGCLVVTEGPDSRTIPCDVHDQFLWAELERMAGQ